MKFSVNDKVVPISKSESSYGRSGLDTSVVWAVAQNIKQPFLYVRTCESPGVYLCSDTQDGTGDYFLGSDLIPYVEPEAETKATEKKDRPFQVGDRVRSISDIGKGNIGTIKRLHPCSNLDCIVEFDVSCTGFNLLGCKPGHACVKNFVNLKLLHPINHCPEPKTITEFGATFIFNGPETVCIIPIDGRKFKGIAKCAPEDTWDENTGKGWAGLRAMHKLLKATEKNLKRKETVGAVRG